MGRTRLIVEEVDVEAGGDNPRFNSRFPPEGLSVSLSCRAAKLGTSAAKEDRAPYRRKMDSSLI